MQLVAPDIIADLCGLSLGVLITTAAVGLVLWLRGWWSHRFWIVLGTTVGAGVYGLQHAATLNSHPMVGATLLAVAAGVLALHLVRFVVFAAGGISGLMVLQAAAPTFEQPLAVFVVSGLLSLLLFRWFLISLTSLLGAMLLCYAGLAILHQRGGFDVVAWSAQGVTLLNWVCGLAASMGFGFQFLVERRARRRLHEEDDDDGEAGLLFGLSSLYRKAG